MQKIIPGNIEFRVVQPVFTVLLVHSVGRKGLLTRASLLSRDCFLFSLSNSSVLRLSSNVSMCDDDADSSLLVLPGISWFAGCFSHLRAPKKCFTVS